MQGSRLALAALATAGLAAALLMLLWAATSGPGRVVSGGPHAQTAVPTATATPRPAPQGRRTTDRQPPPKSSGTLDLSWLGELVEAGLLLGAGWLLWLGGRAIRDRALARDHPTRIAAPFETLPDPADVAERVSSDRQEHLARLAEGTPRNGIVRCWVLFEEEAHDLGVGPAPSETPTEFLTRFLHRLDVDPRPAARLAGLYHEARFSSHELTEADREAARQALLDLHADLAAVAPARAWAGSSTAPEGER